MSAQGERKRQRVWLSRRGAWIIVMFFALLTRLPTLGLQAPWVDEILSWQIADRYGPRLYRGLHPLTYFAQAMGLAVSDSTWGLRLPSAVFGLLSVMAAAGWAMRRLGPLHALYVGLVLALSPFAIFYSQDANHYGPLLLSGVLASVSVDWFLERPRPRWVGFFLCALFVAMTRWFHPVGAFAAASLAILFVAWLVARARELPPRDMPPRLKRLLLLLAAAMLGAAAAHRGLFRLLDAQGPSFPHARAPGLNWPFLSAFLADFFGALFHHRPLDIVLGMSGLVLSAAGWTRVARRSTGRWPAAGALLTVLCATLPFFVLCFTHYFAPRYTIAALPPMLMGIGILIAEVVQGLGGVSRARAWQVVVALWCGLFVVRFAVWEVSRLRHDHQPTWAALDWMRGQTPDNAILVSRNRYSSRCLDFLWDRYDMGGREHVALSYVPLLGAPSIQQAEELAQETGRPVYFLSLIEREARLAPDFDAWLDERTASLAWFASGSPDEFVPIDWGITIRQVRPLEGNPFALPRNGGSPSGILLEERVGGRVHAGHPRLSLFPGTGASYRIAAQPGAKGVILRCLIEHPENGHEAEPLELVAGYDDGPMRIYSLDTARDGTLDLLFPHPAPQRLARMDLAVVGAIRPTSQSGDSLVVHEILAWSGDAAEEREPGRKLVALGSPRKRVDPIALFPPTKDAPGVSSDTLVAIPFRNGREIDTASWDLSDDVRQGDRLVLVQRFWPRGLGDRALAGSVGFTAQSQRVFLPPIDWSASKVMAAASVEVPPQERTLSRSLLLVPYMSLRPWTSQLAIDPPRLYRIAEADE